MSVVLRRVVLFGAPALAYLAGMLHPTHVLVHGSPWLYLGVHLAWPLLACLLAWMVILLVEGVDGAAAAARVLAPVRGGVRSSPRSPGSRSARSSGRGTSCLLLSSRGLRPDPSVIHSRSARR